jgi:hypothetical protein
LTDEMVASAERELSVTLPKAYIDLMHTCNGGYTRDAVLRTSQPTGWAPDHVPVDVIYGIPAVGERGRFGTGLGILATEYLTSEWDLPDDLVLLTGHGHWWIALDYRRSGRSGPPPSRGSTSSEARICNLRRASSPFSPILHPRAR